MFTFHFSSFCYMSTGKKNSGCNTWHHYLLPLLSSFPCFFSILLPFQFLITTKYRVLPENRQVRPLTISINGRSMDRAADKIVVCPPIKILIWYKWSWTLYHNFGRISVYLHSASSCGMLLTIITNNFSKGT